MSGRTLGLALFAVLAAACGAGRVPAWERPWTTGTRGDDAALVREGDVLFEQRGNEKRLRAALVSWEKAALARPEKAATWVKLARGYHLLADGFLFPQAETKYTHMEELIAAHERGVTSAERALWLVSPALKAKVLAGTSLAQALAVLDGTAVPALYWYAVNLVKWSHGRGHTITGRHRATVRAAMSRILELDATYWFGGADRYFGALYADLSSLRGGDVERSRLHFEKALAIAPGYFGTRVLMAELYWGKRVRNRQRYRETLKAVTELAVDVLPGIEPEQRIERKRAASLLKKCDEQLF